MSWSPWIWMYLNEQFPMVCLGCLENKYFPRDLINPVGWFSTKPSGTYIKVVRSSSPASMIHRLMVLLLLYTTGSCKHP